MTKKNQINNDGAEQLLRGIFMLVAGGLLTLISYLIWGTTFGYYYVYIGLLGFGLIWTIAGIYNLFHPKKKFNDALSSLSRKLFRFGIFLFIAGIAVFIIYEIVKLFSK